MNTLQNRHFNFRLKDSLDRTPLNKAIEAENFNFIKLSLELNSIESYFSSKKDMIKFFNKLPADMQQELLPRIKHICKMNFIELYLDTLNNEYYIRYQCYILI